MGWRPRSGRRVVALAAAFLVFVPTLPLPVSSQKASTCVGTAARGRLEHGWKLPGSGPNFRSYSRLGSLLGRTFVHSSVYAAVLGAYERLAEQRPEVTFIYGETGRASGGPFRPHRTHQNGTSVDFMVPVRDGQGRASEIPRSPFNRFGYDVEFDRQGRSGDLRIDFDAISAHLAALDRAAREHGIALRRVILAPDLQPLLHETPAWPAIANRVQLSTRPAWVRHDDHYHVDFEVACEALSAQRELSRAIPGFERAFCPGLPCG